MNEKVLKKTEQLRYEAFTQAVSIMDEWTGTRTFQEFCTKGLIDFFSAENTCLSQFFYLTPSKEKALIDKHTAGLQINRYFVGDLTDPKEKEKWAAVLEQCKKDYAEVDAIPDMKERILAEQKVAKKYEGVVVYKCDDAIDIVIAYNVLPHPQKDKKAFDALRKKTKRFLSKVELKSLNSRADIEQACKSTRIRYDEQWADAILKYAQAMRN